MTRKSKLRLKRIREANLGILDDLMFMAIDRREANLLFYLINELYNQSSILLTSNKGPGLLGDPTLTAAILDRLIHRSEVIQLGGDCYRMKYRSTIFH